MTDHSGLTDEELLQAYRSDHNNQWLGLLLQRYTTLLFGVAYKYLKDHTQAEDAVQHIFMKVLTHLPAEPITNFKGWLYVLMRNHCLQQLRDKVYHSGDEALAAMPAHETSTGELLEREYTLQQMSDAIEELGEEQRRSIVLFYLKKCTYEQIIAQTGYTFMQVKSYIQNGKRNLKSILLKKAGYRHS